MSDTSEAFHEMRAELTKETIDRHRAIESLREELEAIDWYDQRIDATGDDELRKILIHNRDEEKEHAAMVIEWLRRRDSVFAEMLDEYLYQGNGPGAHGAAATADSKATKDDSLGIGSLKGDDNDE